LGSVWRVMAEAKVRAGCDPDRVVWVSAVAVARLKWCQWAAVVEARENEERVFRTWLLDRARLAVAGGVVRAVPAGLEEQVDLAFSELPGGEVLGGDGALGLALLPGGVSGGGPRRWARVGRFFVAAEPDGIEDGTVVEREDPLAYPARYVWPVAQLHADLCGVVFGVSNKLVRVGDEEVAEPVNTGAAEVAVELFRRLEWGEVRPVPPRPWKCRVCGVWEDCVLVAG